MLKIINRLAPFFEDCYRRISVREYAKIIKVSPPTASKLLKHYRKEGLLLSKQDRGFLFFRANRASKAFVLLSRIYWTKRLKRLAKHIEKQLVEPTIVLFGSLAKAEAKEDSDVDLAVFTANKKELRLSKFEKKLGRSIQVFIHKNIHKAPKNLRRSITNGHALRGKL